MVKPNNYNLRLIDTIYEQVPAFADLFDEDAWYVFTTCFVTGACVLVFILSRFITIQPVD
jgi:hypothetical protein